MNKVFDKNSKEKTFHGHSENVWRFFNVQSSCNLLGVALRRRDFQKLRPLSEWPFLRFQILFKTFMKFFIRSTCISSIVGPFLRPTLVVDVDFFIVTTNGCVYTATNGIFLKDKKHCNVWTVPPSVTLILVAERKKSKAVTCYCRRFCRIQKDVENLTWIYCTHKSMDDTTFETFCFSDVCVDIF